MLNQTDIENLRSQKYCQIQISNFEHFFTKTYWFLGIQNKVNMNENNNNLRDIEIFLKLTNKPINRKWINVRFHFKIKNVEKMFEQCKEVKYDYKHINETKTETILIDDNMIQSQNKSIEIEFYFVIGEIDGTTCYDEYVEQVWWKQ